MTAIPEGGWTEVEWGVRYETPSLTHVKNLSGDQVTARLLASEKPPHHDVALVAREVAYGPWVTVTADQQGVAMELHDNGRQVHYGARQPDGTTVDYHGNRGAAEQAATMPGCELVESDFTNTPWMVIANPLDGGTEGSRS